MDRGIAMFPLPTGAILCSSDCCSSDSGVQYSTDVSEPRLRGWLRDSDSDGFSTDVSDTRRKRLRVQGVGLKLTHCPAEYGQNMVWHLLVPC